MELAWLDVQRDHAKVRDDAWQEVVLDVEFASLLDDAVAAVRARETPPDADADAARAAEFLTALSTRHIDAPLTRTSLLVVLRETFRAAAEESETAPRALLVAAARNVFSQPNLEDVWDTHFLVLPAVARFAALHAKLAEERRVAEKLPAPTELPPAQPLDGQVFFDKGRPWVGPWMGWTSDLVEKLNKRQQRPVRAVWMDRYETTCGQYAIWLDSLPPTQRRAMLPQGWTLDTNEAAHAPSGRERHPVTGVTWRQAASFAEASGRRLPTCDEWERAAAGGEKEARVFPWGASEEGKSWIHLGTEPKGTFPVDGAKDDATPEGVVGMAGNAAEIVATWSDRADIAKGDRAEKGDRKRQVVVCGGSYVSHVSECTTNWRWAIDDDGASPSVGFRCVMDEAEYKRRHPSPR